MVVHCHIVPKAAGIIYPSSHSNSLTNNASPPKSAQTKESSLIMKTALPGLLEVMVVRANFPSDLHSSVVTSTQKGNKTL